MFFSPHKFIGGPQTPGVLVVRRDLVRNRVPTVPGGGTIAFVDPVSKKFSQANEAFSQMAQRFGALPRRREITEATALALMEDMLTNVDGTAASAK